MAGAGLIAEAILIQDALVLRLVEAITHILKQGRQLAQIVGVGRIVTPAGGGSLGFRGPGRSFGRSSEVTHTTPAMTATASPKTAVLVSDSAGRGRAMIEDSIEGLIGNHGPNAAVMTAPSGAERRMERGGKPQIAAQGARIERHFRRARLTTPSAVTYRSPTFHCANGRIVRGVGLHPQPGLRIDGPHRDPRRVERGDQPFGAGEVRQRKTRQSDVTGPVRGRGAGRAAFQKIGNQLGRDLFALGPIVGGMGWPGPRSLQDRIGQDDPSSASRRPARSHRVDRAIH